MSLLFDGVDVQRTIQRLSVIRHLPPGTRLEQPRSAEERQLLADLVELADEQDPVAWLEAERRPLCAHIALQAALEQLTSRVIGLQRLLWYGFDVPDSSDQQQLGKLLHLPEAFDLFAPLEQAGLVNADTLRSILARARQARGSAEDVHLREGAAETLLAGLLLLPSDADPLLWLATEQSFLCAVATLRHVLSQSRPPLHSLQIGPTVQVQYPRAALPTNSAFQVIIDEIVFGKGGTRITTHLRIDMHRYLRSDAAHHVSPDWPGFNQLIDDHGNSYLLQHWESKTSHTLWWSTHQVRAAFYPAPAAEATRLTFSTDSKFVDIRELRLPPDDSKRPTRALLAQLPLGEIKWRVAVPAG